MTLCGHRNGGAHNSGKGAVVKWLRAQINYQGDDCLIWPFSRQRGYGVFGFRGKKFYAHRMLCEWVNGPAPTPKHEVAHSCGRGHLGCINPRHLSWKTRTENQRDRVTHKTAGRPGVSMRLKLSAEDVAEIRAIGPNMTKEDLGRRYNVTPANIAKILNGKTWRRNHKKFSQQEVEHIRASKGILTLRQLAEQYDVKQSAIWRIQARHSYRHFSVGELEGAKDG